MELNYKKDINIDSENLEDEWVKQPSLFLYYAEAHAEALYEKDLAKSAMDLLYAKMYSSIKKNWDKYFDSKPTEPALKEFIMKHKDFQKAERRLINITKDVNIMLAAKTAFDHRKRALENLVSLRISGVHSEPRNRTKKPRHSGGDKEIKNSLNETENRATSRKTKKD